MRLQRLDAMREAGARLMGRDRIGRDVFTRGAPEGLRVVRKAAWDVSLYELISAYGGIQARMTPAVHVVERRPVMTLDARSEEHTSELQALMRISYAVFCLKKNKPQSNEATQSTKNNISH